MGNLLLHVELFESMTDKSGLESSSYITRIHDFVSHFFIQFVGNVKDATKKFSRSEIAHFNSRYKRQLNDLLSDPTFSIPDDLVAIPKGMVNSYLQTLHSLVDVLSSIRATHIKRDLMTIMNAVAKQDIKLISTELYSKNEFESDKSSIGNLYSSRGLTHAKASQVLSNRDDTKEVNDLLLTITEDYYSEAISISEMVLKLDKIHSTENLTDNEKEKLKYALLNLAYRISLFAIILDHIQVMEYTFVKTLEKFLKT